MRVLHLIKTSVGAAWALRQIRILTALDVEVHVAIPSEGPMVGKYLKVGAVEHYLQCDFPVRRPWQFMKTYCKLNHLVRQINPNITHSHFVGTTLSMRLALRMNKKIPRIFQVPGPLHLKHYHTKMIDKITAGKNDYYIGSCEWTYKKYLKEGVPEKKVFLSYYGTDIDTFTPKPSGKLRSELSLPAQSKIVGMVAFMYPPKRIVGKTKGQKGHEDLIDAIALCLKKKKNIYCVMVGGAWNGAIDYENEIRKYAYYKCGDRIIILGNRDDVPELYADFDIAVHPSHHENVGGASESLLLGVPTIATNVGGFPDVIVDGITGWLVPPKDPQFLSESILNALNHPEDAKRRAAKGQEIARDLLDVKNTALEIKKIYKKILSEKL